MTQRSSLPRYSGVTPDPRALAENMRDVLLWLQGLPEIDVVRFRWHGDVPFEIASPRVQEPGIVVLQGYEERDTSASVTPELPTFERMPGGVRILAVDGFTAGTEYVVSALIVGA